MTWGLDVAGTTTSVSSTTESVVNTTQQAASNTVATVETTVQQTTQAAAPVTQVQPTVESVAAPAAPAAPAAAPTPAATPAPKASAPRAGAPSASPTRASANRQRASVAPRSLTTTAATTVESVRARVHRAAAREDDGPLAPVTAVIANPRTGACQFVSAGAGMGALLSILCETGTLLFGAPAGASAPAAPATNPVAGAGEVLGRIASGVNPALAPLVGLVDRNRRNRLAGREPLVARQRIAPVHASGGRFGSIQPTAAVSPGVTGADRSAANSAPAASHPGASSDGLFSGRMTGTEVVILALLLESTLLALLVTWRLARRWVVPRAA